MVFALGDAVSSFPNQNVGIHAGYPLSVAVAGWLIPDPNGLLKRTVEAPVERFNGKVPLYTEVNPAVVTKLPCVHLVANAPFAAPPLNEICVEPFELLACAALFITVSV